MMITINIFIKIGAVLLIILASFLSPLQEILSRNTIVLVYSVALVCLCVPYIKTPKIFFRKRLFFNYILLLIVFVMFIYNNQNLKYHDIGYFMIGFSAILFMMILPFHNDWFNVAIKAVSITSLIHIAATYIFLINPSLWTTYAISVFKSSHIPGTINGTRGYTAALNEHYSTNGTLLAFGAICAMAYYLSSTDDREKKRNMILIIFSCIAVLLTQKRAHVLFFAITFIIVYTFFEIKKGAIKTMIKLIAICILVWIALNVLIHYVPLLSGVFERFLSIGEDSQTLTRLTMWDYALDLFSSHKLLGIGWGGYRYRFSAFNMYEGAANAHNIYFQLLAETGIIGFISFVLFAGINLYNALFMLLNKRRYQFNKEEQIALTFSASFQIFILLYGLTGNPIYDFCFIYYAIAVSISMSFLYRVRKEKVINKL